jgi:hypothetical protein
MRKVVAFVAFAVLGLAVVPGMAEDPPHLDFIRELRARNFGELAIEYLDRLKADKLTPNAIRDVIPLERGRIRMEQASNEFNVARRNSYYKSAREEFESFVKLRPNDPYAAEAKFEAARILALQGRTQLSKAQRLQFSEEGAGGVATAEFQKAYDLLLQAERELKATLPLIDDQLAKALPPAISTALTQAKLRCRLEINVTAIDRASTFEALNKNVEEADALVKGAIAELRKVHAEDAKNPICWLARTHVGRGFQVIDRPKDAETEFKAVLDEKSPPAEQAQRLARFLTFLDKCDPRRRKASDNDKIAQLGEEWLKLHSGYKHTPEGIVLRFETAKTYEFMAAGLTKPTGPLEPKAKDLLDKAEVIYNDLDEIETEFSEDIQQRKLQISLKKFGNVDIKDIRTITSFPQGYSAMKALAVLFVKAKNADERKTVLEKVIEVINRTSDLYEPGKHSEAQYAEVRGNLSWAFRELGDPHKAVVVGEHFVMQMPHLPKAPAAGVYALQAYAQMIMDSADPRWAETDTERMAQLLKVMEKTWKVDTNTDAARHQVGTMLLRQKKAREAADVLSRVSDNYKPAGAMTDARWWWAAAAQQMLNEKISEKEKLSYQMQVRKALEGIPEIRSDEPGEVAQMYVQAKLQLGQFFFETKRFNEMESLALTLQKRLPAFKNLDASYRTDLERTADALVWYAQYGKGMAALNAGKVKEARTLVDPVLQKVSAQVDALKKEETEARKALDSKEGIMKISTGKEKDKLEAEVAVLKDRADRLARNYSRDVQLQRGLMIVALRAAVLDDNPSRAGQLLEGLQKIAADSQVGPAIYVQIVAEIHKQINDLKKGNDKALLDRTVKSFRGFLDQLAGRKLNHEMVFFLANAYSSLDNYGEAGKLLAKVPALVKDAKDKDGKPLDDKKKEDLARAAQYMSLQNLRKGRQFKDAEAMLIQILKTDWGSKSTQIAEEQALLMQDQSKWGGAAKGWRDLMTMLKPRMDKGDAKAKEDYYEAYYNYVYCLYWYAMSLTDVQKKQDYIKRAATVIVNLEKVQEDFGSETLREKYRQLLKEQPALNREYLAAKTAAAAAPKQ